MVRQKINKEKLSQFCREHEIEKLALFGSILTDHFKKNSDVDVLISFKEGREPGLFGFSKISHRLSEEFFPNHLVDLVTYLSLREGLREMILASSEVQYDEQKQAS